MQVETASGGTCRRRRRGIRGARTRPVIIVVVELVSVRFRSLLVGRRCSSCCPLLGLVARPRCVPRRREGSGGLGGRAVRIDVRGARARLLARLGRRQRVEDVALRLYARSSAAAPIMNPELRAIIIQSSRTNKTALAISATKPWKGLAARPGDKLSAVHSAPAEG